MRLSPAVAAALHRELAQKPTRLQRYSPHRIITNSLRAGWNCFVNNMANSGVNDRFGKEMLFIPNIATGLVVLAAALVTVWGSLTFEVIGYVVGLFTPGFNAARPAIFGYSNAEMAKIEAKARAGEPPMYATF
jgi:hypothetical protein